MGDWGDAIGRELDAGVRALLARRPPPVKRDCPGCGQPEIYAAEAPADALCVACLSTPGI